MSVKDVSAKWPKTRRVIREELALYVPFLSDGPDRAHIAYIFLNLTNFAFIPSHKDSRDELDSHGDGFAASTSNS